MTVPYYVVNAGRGRSTHIMKSKSPSTPDPLSPEGIVAQLLWCGGNAKSTLCGLQATRYVDVFSPAEASCRECRRRWQLAVAAEAASRRPVPGLTQEQSQVQLRRAPQARWLIPALKSIEAAKFGRCPRCGRRITGAWAGKHWTDGVHLSYQGKGYCPGPGKLPPQRRPERQIEDQDRKERRGSGLLRVSYDGSKPLDQALRGLDRSHELDFGNGVTVARHPSRSGFLLMHNNYLYDTADDPLQVAQRVVAKLTSLKLKLHSRSQDGTD